MCVYETGRIRMRTVESHYGHNPPGNWTQASAKFPITTARGHCGMSSGSVALLLYVFIYLLSIWHKHEIKSGSPSLKRVYVFTACVACVLVVSVADISQFPIAELLLSTASIIFLLRLQILLRSRLQHTAVLRQVCLILTHSHLGLFPVTAN